MKKMILIVVIAVFYCSILAQGSSRADVPQSVKNAFSFRYPTVHVKKWKIENENYVAQYYLDNKKHSAVYSSDANWIMTETKITWSWNLPPVVEKAFYHSDFKKWKLFEMTEVQTSNGTEYVLHVNDGLLLDSDHAQFTEDYKLYFDSNGTLLKKEKME